MEPHRVLVFFYGSYINLAVLREAELRPDAVEVARLDGYTIEIAPIANLRRAEGECVHGILLRASHEELERLYTHAREVLGGVYLPEAVLCETAEGARVPALCYIAPQLAAKCAANHYIDRIVGPAREYGFPEAYIARLESFRP